MSKISVKKVTTKKELSLFVEFPNNLYKGNEFFVPKISMDEKNTFNPKKNPAFKFSECQLFLAYKDGEIAGRVAAIINHKANEIWNHKEVRFGWIDFIDDIEVTKALLSAVEAFGKERGMDTICGPLGFMDFDPEGMLVDGFDRMCTMALIYNYPYYKEHMEALGYVKETEWVEFRITVPERIPEKITKVSRLVQERYGFRIRKVSKKEVLREGIGLKIFHIVNDTYKNLYNFTPLSDDLIEHYINTYLKILDFNYVTCIEDADGQMAGFGVAVPSVARALQKCRGKIFPFGWYHIAKSYFFKHEDTIELLLVGVLPQYQNKGAMALIFDDLIPRMLKGGFKFGESNAELESNIAMQQQWQMFESESKKRRRIYKKVME